MNRNSQRPEAMPFRGAARKEKQIGAAREEISWISPQLWTSLRETGTDAHRVATGGSLWLECFGSDFLLSYKSDAGRDLLMAELDRRCAGFGFMPRRVFGKFLPKQAAERDSPALLRGELSLPMETETQEAGVRFGLDFAAGYSAGLFIDQRANRERLRHYRPKRVLNTFAYTCSFSVVAALGGAETVSVDLSRRSLTRGEENFRRNLLDPKAGHKFVADDVLTVLPRLANRGERFDAIILDPPTFSRNQTGAAFQVQRDFDRLIGLALEVASPGARILLSVNHSEMRVGDLERAARVAMRMQNYAGRFQAPLALPDFPPGHGAKTVWLELKPS